VSARPQVAIVDIGSGNLRSVEKSLVAAGGDAFVTGDPEAVSRADKVVVPGQGHFGVCVKGLARDGGALREAVLASIAAGKSFLGLCVGLQILFDGSEEDPATPGLGLIRGTVRRFVVPAPLKVPHMGWNACATGPADRGGPIGRTPDGSYFYFVHSYYPAPADPRQVALWSDYAGQFCAAVAKDNVLACQFHPEKSQSAGLALLNRFVTS
jgi:imidazole glycerol-phosphate synthase subunit HisH